MSKESVVGSDPDTLAPATIENCSASAVPPEQAPSECTANVPSHPYRHPMVGDTVEVYCGPGEWCPARVIGVHRDHFIAEVTEGPHRGEWVSRKAGATVGCEAICGWRWFGAATVGRRCAGIPPHTCETILGPESPGPLCAYCERVSAAGSPAYVVETIPAGSEPAVHEECSRCDGCHPGQDPVSGYLCASCRRARRAVVGGAGAVDATTLTHVVTLDLLVELRRITPSDAVTVARALDRVGAVLRGAVAPLSRSQRTVWLALVRDLVDAEVEQHQAARQAVRA